MQHLKEIHIDSLPIERYVRILGEHRVEELKQLAVEVRELLHERIVWHINSTAKGGGVAEMLPSLLGYTCGLGVTTRWIVIEGRPDFFAVTKRLHNALHGELGNGSELDAQAHRIYEDTLKDNWIELLTLLRPGDIVILHDPQTAGLAPILADHGVLVLWRCHIGRDERTEEVDKAWNFLKGYLKPVIRYLFSRREYIPDFLNDKRSVIIRPSIDPFSSKNHELDSNTIQSILTHCGLISGPLPMSPNLQFNKIDGSTGRIDRHADIIRCGSPPQPDTPLITQISRWDRLKDAKGLILGYREWLNVSSSSNAELILAGPSVHGVADDPAAPVVFKEVFDAWCQLPHWQRSRVHLVMLPMVDIEENAAIVNALQRHSTVIVQKSLREGFGLTVTEAMWKHKPIIGSKVGGIQDQIKHGYTGLLLEVPSNPVEFSDCLEQLMINPEFANELGERAYRRVCDHYLGTRSLTDYAELIKSLFVTNPTSGS